MSLVCVLGDLHFGARSDNPIIQKHQHRFFEEVLFPYLKKHEINEVLQVGDVFDRRKYINFVTLYNARKSFFDVLRDRDIKTHILLGNHDCALKNSNHINSPSLLLKEYENINVYEEAQDAMIGGVRMCIVPWMNSSNAEATMNHVALSIAKICVGHLELNGFEMHAGFVNQGGMESNIFKTFDLTITGHFHLRTHKYGISYVGTPYDFVWEDYGETKGFHILDTETNELTFVPNPNQLFKKIIYHDKLDLASITIEEFKETYIKVIVKEKTNQKHFNKLIDKLNTFDLSDLDILDIEVVSDEEQQEDAEILNKPTLSVIHDYVEMQAVTYDKETMKGYLSELYVEAMNKDE